MSYSIVLPLPDISLQLPIHVKNGTSAEMTLTSKALTESKVECDALKQEIAAHKDRIDALEAESRGAKNNLLEMR